MDLYIGKLLLPGKYSKNLHLKKKTSSKGNIYLYPNQKIIIKILLAILIVILTFIIFIEIKYLKFSSFLNYLKYGITNNKIKNKEKTVKKNGYDSQNITLINHIENENIKGEIYVNLSRISDKNIYKYKMLQKMRDLIIWPIKNKLQFKPIMSDLELIAFSYFMKEDIVYFEFGSGGSTNIAFFYNVSKIYSVESDVEWHNKLKSKNIKVNYLTKDLKCLRGNLGNPGKDTNIEDWKKYIQAYDKKYKADVILIDGRFRVACALDIFSKIFNDTLVLMHDYAFRKQYHIIENYYIKIRSWDTLSAFFKNPNIEAIPDDVYQKYLRETI